MNPWWGVELFVDLLRHAAGADGSSHLKLALKQIPLLRNRSVIITSLEWDFNVKCVLRQSL